MAPTLPTELINEIILEMYDTCCPHLPFGLCDSVPRTSCVCKPAWSDIERLTLVSKTFRALTLRIWLRVCRVCSPDEIDLTVEIWPQSVDWVERLIAEPWVARSPIEDDWNFSPFKRLWKLRLACAQERAGDLPEPSFVIGASKVTELELTGFRSPSPHLLKSITPVTFPRVRVLRLWTEEIYCRMCWTAQLVPPSYPLPPRRLMYEGGSGLPTGTDDYLVRMSELHSVQVILCYDGNVSAESMTIAHMGEDDHSTEPHSRLDHDMYRWTGLCFSCMYFMDHEGFADDEDYVRAKVDDSANRPLALRRVEWAFVPRGYFEKYSV